MPDSLHSNTLYSYIYYCRCYKDEVYTYSGEYCEHKAKTLLSRSVIDYTIATVIGGLSAVLVITVVICCVYISKRANRKTEYDNENM